MADVASIISSPNRLLSGLSSRDVELLAPHLDAITMDLRFSLEQPNSLISHAYFMESGIASVVAGDGGKMQIEVSVVGREGVTGLAVILGDTQSPNATFIQAAGSALRISAAELRNALDQSTSLRSLLLKYAQVFMIQASQTALSNGRSKIEDRLARWILMAQDRIDGPELPLTHEFLSTMLGVRRAGVTDALHALEARGLIKASWRSIRIVDREGLIEHANGAYGVAEAAYDRLIGTRRLSR